MRTYLFSPSHARTHSKKKENDGLVFIGRNEERSNGADRNDDQNLFFHRIIFLDQDYDFPFQAIS